MQYKATHNKNCSDLTTLILNFGIQASHYNSGMENNAS